VNPVAAIMWLLSWHLWIRIVLTCTIETVNIGIIEQFVDTLVNALNALWQSLTDFLTIGDPNTNRLDLYPFLTYVGQLVQVFGTLLDCGCSYLSFAWTGLLDLFSSLNFQTAINDLVNAGIAAIQSIFLAVLVLPRSPPFLSF
jgi:hypothetical protein